MTNLAQLRDCHSCYDERSIDQKKRSHVHIESIPNLSESYSEICSETSKKKDRVS